MHAGGVRPPTAELRSIGCSGALPPHDGMLVAEVGGGGCAEVGRGVSVFVIINRGFFVGITWMYLWFGV